MTNPQEKLTHVYVRDEASCWVPALQVHSHAGKATIVKPVFKTEQQMLQCGARGPGKQKYTREEKVDLSSYPNKCLPMQNVDTNGNLEDYKDMVELCFMHEVSIPLHRIALHPVSRVSNSFSLSNHRRPFSTT